MQHITLENFEQHIDPTIVKRGKDYYRKDQVISVDEIGPSHWSAVVMGSDEYTVDIDLNTKNHQSLFICDCPYDGGPVCKHIVAVLYYVKNGEPQEKTRKHTTQTRGNKKRKKETILSKIQNTLETLSQKQLQSLCLELLIDNEHAQHQFFQEFTNEPINKKQLIKIAKDSLRRGKDRSGFIDYWSVDKAVPDIEELFAIGENSVQQQQFSQAIPYFQAIIEVMVPALQSADDSDGVMGGLIDESFHNLLELATQLNLQDAQELLLFSCKEAFQEKYQGWSEWQFNWLMIAVLSARSQNDKELLTETIAEMRKYLQLYNKQESFIELMNFDFERDDEQPNKTLNSFEEQQLAEIEYQLTKQVDGEKDSLNYLKNHLQFDNLRLILTQYYFDHQQFDTAKRLAQEYIDSKNKIGYGIDKNILIILFDIAKHKKNEKEILQWGKLLFIITQSFTYYDQIRKMVTTENWSIFFEELCEDLSTGNENFYSSGSGILAEIYHRENMVKELLSLAQNNNFWIIETYRKTLEKKFPEEVIKLYLQRIDQKMNDTYGLNRKTYQEVCRILRRIRKLGFSEICESKTIELRKKFPKRKALLEELALV